ncbi:hypothetical protein GCM10007895_18290 [Paraferrimonas sedimenticola]|uniref:Uncharacterized protein n=1 Tax=Paraferrimonas sedimenticola TaxID=375674 RepID=A0AA37W168_9GAMM|nr:hypothetical protein GCM10007895_18290 [Paraferrimonas sedimenticola]
MIDSAQYLTDEARKKVQQQSLTVEQPVMLISLQNTYETTNDNPLGYLRRIENIPKTNIKSTLPYVIRDLTALRVQ